MKSFLKYIALPLMVFFTGMIIYNNWPEKPLQTDNEIDIIIVEK